MKKLTIGLSLAAMAFAGAAYAQQGLHSKYDADGDGAMSRAEMQAMSTQMFARMDANDDGKLDEADRAARRTQMFDRMDTDKNGQISREEFMAKPQRGPKAGADGKMGDGWHGGMGGRGGHGGRGMMMMDMADTNNDGSVSLAEFAAAALQHFDTADTNKDGKVTKEERQAAHATMREMRHDRMGGAPSPKE